MSVRRWGRRAGIFLTLWAIYAANGRELGSGDTAATSYLAVALVYGDGPVLDRFVSTTQMARPPYWAVERGGHLVSLYPLLPALLAAPVVAPQVLGLELRRPGWDATAASTWWYIRRMAKTTATALTAVTGVLLGEVLGVLTLPVLWPIVVTMLGSPLWTVASQALWQHTVAPLALTTAWWLLVRTPPTPPRLVGAGLATGTLVGTRLADVPLALALVAIALGTVHGRGRGWFLAPLLALLAAVVAYNVRVFGTIVGGQAELEALHGVVHAVAGSWGDPIRGGLGTLLSPNRGLFIFCPWVALTLALLPLTWRSLRRPRGLRPLLLAVAAIGAINATYAVWWGGVSYGPRFWTDVMPVFGVLFAVTWQTLPRLRVLLIGAGSIAIALQALGAWCYPSTWNRSPTDVDRAHARLWEWQDSEVTRMLREGPRPREFSPLPF